jgi:hypothetical protein
VGNRDRAARCPGRYRDPVARPVPAASCRAADRPAHPGHRLAVAGLAIAFAGATGKASSEVLFSGQSALGPLIAYNASHTVGALLLLIACKSLAWPTACR